MRKLVHVPARLVMAFALVTTIPTAVALFALDRLRDGARARQRSAQGRAGSSSPEAEIPGPDPP
jgi:hypothetical protein